MPLYLVNNEERNYNCTVKILKTAISEGVRTIFIQEWNNRYQATHGAWDNTARSGQQLFNMEHGRPSAKRYLDEYRNGNLEELDCTALFDAILFSNCIGASLNPVIKAELHNLRVLRNETLHAPKNKQSELHFEDAAEKVRQSLLVLQLPTKEVDDIKIERKPVKLVFLLLILTVIPSCLVCKFLYEEKPITSFQVLPGHPAHDVIIRNNNVSAIIGDLKKQYTNNSGKLTYYYISGNPGSGKSQLARQIGATYYIDQIKGGSTFVMTLNARTPESLLESYQDFAHRLHCNETIVARIFDSNQTTEVKIRQLRTQITTRVKNYVSWLVIVDNVEDSKLVSSLLPELGSEEWGNGQVLVTTQDSIHIPPNSSLTHHVSVSPGMGVTESCRLLANVSGTAGDADDPMLEEVAEVLDYQPLALAAAAVYLKEVRDFTPEFSWRNYLKKLDEGKKRVTEEELHKINPAYSQTMTIAVLLAVEKAAETYIVLRHTFRFLSLASHESLPLEVVIKYVLLADKDQDREQVGIRIRKCSLILSDAGQDPSIRLHRVIHDAIKIYAKERTLDDSSFNFAVESFYQFKNRSDERILVPHLKVFYAVMKKMFPNCKTLCKNNTASTEIWQPFQYYATVLYHYGEFRISKNFTTAALNIVEEQKEPNEVQIADICNLLGIIYRALGDLQQAKEYHERALNIFIKQLGPNNVDVANSYKNLGNVHIALGDLQQTKKYYEDALDIFIKQLGSNHVDVADSYNNLGNVQKALGDLQQAKKYHEDALDILIKQLGSNHVKVADSYNNLGNVHKAFGDLQQAKKYHEDALDIRIKQLGPNHVDVAKSYNSLGNVHNAFGDLHQAKKYYEDALDIRIKQLGPKHDDVAKSYNNIGNVHKTFGDLQQAKKYYEDALDIRIKQLGPKHVDVAKSYNNLGRVHNAFGDLQQAKKYYEDALDIRIKQLGPKHIDVAKSYNNLGRVHNAFGELQQAKKYYEDALDIRIKQLGPKHVDVAKCYNNFGLLHNALGDLQQAKKYYEDALDIRIKQLGPNHVDVAESYNNLGLAHTALGDLQQAKKYHEDALDIRIKQLGHNHVVVAESYNNLGLIHTALGDLQQAKKYVEDALDIRIKQLGPNHVDVAESYNNLGLVHTALDDLQQAKKYHEDALDIRIKQLGPNHVKVAGSCNNLGNVHKALGDLQQAKKYHEDAINIRIKQLGGPNHIDVANTHNNLGNVTQSLG